MLSNPRNSVRKYLLVILAAAFILRFTGIWYGLPELYNSDEPFNVLNALSYGAKRSLEPTYFVYPTLYSYFLFAVYGLYFLAGRVFGLFEGALDFGAAYFLNPTGLYFIGRFASVLLGVATIGTVFRVADRNFSQKTAWFAAALLTVSFTHVDLSHWILLEPALGFMSAFALFLIFRVSQTGTLQSTILASLVTGLAISTKYNAGLMLLPLFLAIIMAKKERFSKLSLYLALSVLTVLFGFLLGTPHWLFSFSSFFSDLKYTMSHVGTGMVGHVSPIPLAWPFWELIFRDWTVGVLFVAGLIYVFFQRDPKQWLLLSFVLPTLLFVGLWNRTGIHYMLPIFPALAILAAIFLTDILSQVESKHLRTVMLALLFLPPLVRIVYQDIRLTQKDSRTYAKEWIESHIPIGSVVAYENYVYGPNLFDPRRFLKNSRESKLLPLELKERLLQERSRRISYILINLRKDFRVRFGTEPGHHPRVTEDPYFRQLLDMRLPRLSSVKKAGVRYLVISSDNYDRYFSTPEPKKGTPLWLGYQNGRHFYEAVFASEDLRLIEEFRATKWNLGPTIRLYEFKRPQNELNAK